MINIKAGFPWASVRYHTSGNWTKTREWERGRKGTLLYFSHVSLLRVWIFRFVNVGEAGEWMNNAHRGWIMVINERGVLKQRGLRCDHWSAMVCDIIINGGDVPILDYSTTQTRRGRGDGVLVVILFPLSVLEIIEFLKKKVFIRSDVNKAKCCHLLAAEDTAAANQLINNFY